MMRATFLAPAVACAAPASATLADTGCEPSDLQAASGPTVFGVTNGSSRVLEFEVLSGVRIVPSVKTSCPASRKASPSIWGRAPMASPAACCPTPKAR